MTTHQKKCRHCKHYRPNGFLMWFLIGHRHMYAECTHPRSVGWDVEFAEVMREFPHLCGPDAKLFELKHGLPPRDPSIPMPDPPEVHRDG